jgi:hypothetical protein
MAKKTKLVKELQRLDRAFAKKRGREQKAFIKKRNVLLQKVIRSR